LGEEDYLQDLDSMMAQTAHHQIFYVIVVVLQTRYPVPALESTYTGPES